DPTKPHERETDAQPADRAGHDEGPTSQKSAPVSPPDEVDDEPDLGGQDTSRAEAIDAAIEFFSSDFATSAGSFSPIQEAPLPPSAHSPRLSVPLVTATVASGLGSLVRPPQSKRKPAAESRARQIDRWARRARR